MKRLYGVKYAALDLGFVYEETAHLYSRRYGWSPIALVVLVKYLLVGFLYGIVSERQIEQRIQTDAALQWYLGPDHSTIFQLRAKWLYRSDSGCPANIGQTERIIPAAPCGRRA